MSGLDYYFFREIGVREFKNQKSPVVKNLLRSVYYINGTLHLSTKTYINPQRVEAQLQSHRSCPPASLTEQSPGFVIATQVPSPQICKVIL